MGHSTNGDPATALFGVGEALRRQGRHAAAATCFHRALADAPQHVPSLHRLGNAHKALGQWGHAERAYRRAAVLDYNNPELLRQLANVLKDLDRPDEAEPFCLHGLALSPHDETLHFALAVVLGERSQQGRAKAALRRVLAIRPDYAPALHRYGLVLKDEGLVHEAATVFRRSLRSDPWQSATFHRIGTAWRELGWRDRAAAAYRRALALDPCDVDALYEFGNLVGRHGGLATAADLFRFGMTVDPASIECKAGLGLVEARRGDAGRALVLWFDAVGLTGALPAEPRSRSASAVPEAASRDPGPVTVGTSLMPRRIDEQRAAVDSWRSLGFDVISVNTAVEIERLKPLFPDIRFERTDRTAEALCGRPLVFLDTCLEALDRSGSHVCGIINSDIVLPDSPACGAALAEQARGRLLFGSRLNVATLQSEHGWVYEGGYDYFLFDRSIIGCLLNSGMVIGSPWWDYWVPLAAALAGFPIAMPCDVKALHCTHELGYSKGIYLHFGEILLAAASRLIEGLDSQVDHPLTGFAVRALPVLSDACASGKWTLSSKAASVLGGLIVETVTTLAIPLSVGPVLPGRGKGLCTSGRW